MLQPLSGLNSSSSTRTFSQSWFAGRCINYSLEFAMFSRAPGKARTKGCRIQKTLTSDVNASVTQVPQPLGTSRSPPRLSRHQPGMCPGCSSARSRPRLPPCGEFQCPELRNVPSPQRKPSRQVPCGTPASRSRDPIRKRRVVGEGAHTAITPQ